MIAVLWLAGLVALALAAILASSRARAMPSDVVGRAAPLAAAIACAGLVGSAAWVWGGAFATTGRADRLRTGAAVRLELASITVPFGTRAIAIGHADGDDVRVPGDGELARVGADAVVQPADGAGLVATTDLRVALALACNTQRTPFALPANATVIAVACDRSEAVAIHREPSVLALSAFGPRGVPVHAIAHAGDVVRIGDDRTALPGVVNWQLAAASGAATLVEVPRDPTDCAAWRHARVTADGACALTEGGFALVARPIVPDAAAVIGRGVRAAIAIGVPALAMLVVLALARPSRRRAHVLAGALRLALLACVLAALACWRLVWAHRIDALREVALGSAGSLVRANSFAIAALGAVIAGLACGVAATRRKPAFALVGWAVWLAVGLAITGAPTELTTVHAGALALSAIATVLPWYRVAASDRRALAVLVAIGGAATVTRAIAPHLVLAKLGLAWACVIAGQAALRAVLAPSTSRGSRIALPIALAFAAVALARLDTGVTVAITGSGLAIAMLVAGLDAVYHAGAAGRLGVLEREHARLLFVHGTGAIAVAIAVASWVLAADERVLVASTTSWVLCAPLVVAALYLSTAIVARTHRRAVLPWLVAAAAATALFCARGPLVERASEGHSVAAARVSAVVSPGYALLRDARAFAQTASAWREAMLPTTIVETRDHEAATGEGYFGAHLADPGVVKSIDNDYVAVLIAREAGAAGVVQTLALLAILALAIAATASVRLRHASAEHRARWLVAAVAFVLCIYQPLAALGVLPLTGIGWPGMALDSPADLWLLVVGASWCLFGGGEIVHDSVDERVRQTPRLRRARTLVLAALVVGGAAAIALVARASASALARTAGDDDRIAAALHYAGSLACPWHDHDGTAPSDVVPAALESSPSDLDTQRFDRELRARWSLERPGLIASLATCRTTGDAAACTADLALGWPSVHLTVAHDDAGWHGSCAVTVPRELEAALHARPVTKGAPRVRVVSAAIGAAARDLGELDTGDAIVRIRPGARDDLGGGASIDATGTAPTLRGAAQLFVASPTGWQRIVYEGSVALDKEALIVASGRVVLFRPGANTLLADDLDRAGERTRRAYPYAAALPELGWVNPWDVDRSLGLDGWIHAALARPAASPASCGTLAPPAITRDRVCTSAPGKVTECRIALQPELAKTLRALADKLAGDAEPLTGHAVPPTRIAYTVLRGDTGELLAQANVVPGRAPLAYAPKDAAAEAELIRLREERGDGDAERVDWNLPIAVGSTFKPIVSRAAELAFPALIDQLTLTAAATPGGCRAHRGKPVDPLLGHCPPTSLADDPTTADLHDFLARSLNWYQAALGLVGLALPDGELVQAGQVRTLAEVVGTDLASWPTKSPLVVRDAKGPIVDAHKIWIDGLRRAPLWQRIEQLLGRPLCTLGDRATCRRDSERADVCAARALPIDHPSRDLRELVSLGPDRIDFYGDDRPGQTAVPVREYFQLLRGSGVHSIGSLAQLADAFGRVVYDESRGPATLAASWFPAPATGTLPTWSCANVGGHAAKVRGDDGGLCAVVQDGGTAHGVFASVLVDPHVVVYGAKTGTTDSLADLAHDPILCEAWNRVHVAQSQLACGKQPPDDSLFVVAFGVVTDTGTIPITLAIQLQRGGKSAAARSAPAWIAAIAHYLRGD
ncbi:MAG TPA: hypothetical protein VH143_34600 [Kofleriaceae bacterium]|nr:hypothetical protein [Kofleriaceae bacterium]